DERIINAVQNSDLDNLDIEIAKILNETAIKIFNDDIYGHIDFYADYFNSEKSEQHISTEKEIYDLLHSQYEKQNEQADRTELESKTIRTVDDIEIGDKYHYKGRDYTVVSMQGVYPDDVGISYEEKLANGTTYAITENVSKYKLESDGVYLGKEIEPDNEISEPESAKRTIPNTIEHRNFAKLEKLFPEIMSKEHIYERHESKELEPLSLEWLDGDYLSVMHTYTLNGDLMRDPDIVLKVDFENETVSAISYENSGFGQYREYEDGSPGQRDTNRFMSDWLKNIEQQEYALSRAMVDYPFENDVYDIKINYKNGNIISVDGDDRAAEDFIKKNKIEIQKDESEITTPEEPDILGTYAIYQLKDGDDTRDYRFISSSEMEKQGLSINKNNYDLVYSGELTADMSLDSIYEKFNTGLPDDFIGHSLSMSDIIVLDTDDGMKAHYVDRFGFKEVPEFLLEKNVEIDNSEQLLKQQQILDSEINSDETIREKNLEALNSIKIGDEITLKGETFVVKSINGSFMMSMDNVKALSGEFIGEASRQFIGNWQNQLADEAGDSLIGISKPDISNTLNNEVQLEETVDNSHSW
ncbi:MAG: YodL domain-containing protein, partial [Hominimerdicola sp.]